MAARSIPKREEKPSAVAHDPEERQAHGLALKGEVDATGPAHAHRPILTQLQRERLRFHVEVERQNETQGRIVGEVVQLLKLRLLLRWDRRLRMRPEQPLPRGAELLPACYLVQAAVAHLRVQVGD